MEHYDVVIVGGGITGASIARDCALRGLTRTLLIEQKSIGQATTAASTGLANRGLRYIDYDLDLTRASAQEVAILQFIAPHLLETRKFLIPFFRDSKFNIELFEAALEAYEAIVGQYGAPKHERLGKGQTLIAEPLLSADVYGSLRIEELLLKDSELAKESVRQAENLGVQVMEGWKVVGIERKNSRLVLALKSAWGDEAKVETQILCNAAGPWAEQFAAQLGCQVKLRPTKGVHILVDRLPLANDLILDSPDHRYSLMAIKKGPQKWVYVGPTDDDFFGKEFDPDNLLCPDWDRQYLLDSLRRAIPMTRKNQIVGAIMGIRPTLFQKGVKPERLSRNFKIFDHEENGLSGFISVAGGKLTIARLMAEKATDLICRKLNRPAECLTAAVPLGKSAVPLRPAVFLSGSAAFSSQKSPLASLSKRIYASGRIGWYFFKHILRNPRSILSFVN